jgi:bacillithiol biosynthesis deacetylase BshB1
MTNYKVDMLAFGAHPDDVELSCGGTLAKHIALGYSAAIVDLTRGELGTRGSAALRKEEADAASKILNIKFRENLGFRDGFFVSDETHVLEVIRMIRKYQPTLVFANAESDRHADHAKGANLVHDACFLAGLRKIETLENGTKQEAWRPKQVYHYIQDRITKPNILVDISSTFDLKMESILAYGSQFYDPNSNEPNTPISSKEFIESIRGRCLEFGKEIGVTYAEGFTVRRTLGASNLIELI